MSLVCNQQNQDGLQTDVVPLWNIEEKCLDQPNHNIMLDESNGKAQFICTAKTVEKFPLVIASKYNIPYLINKSNVGNNIQGEVYEVDQKMLEFLDEFEGYFDYYIRLKAQVICSNTNEHLNAWIYFINRYKPEMLQLPLLSNYDSYGEHGLRYVESETLDNVDDI